MNTLVLGRVRVEAVVETAGPTRPTWLFPAATPEALEPHRAWLAPHFIDAEGRLRQSVHTFAVKAPDLTVLVDTCIGNDKDRGAGARSTCSTPSSSRTCAPRGGPGEVDSVMCTHLHVDHVGWNTLLATGAGCRPFPAPATVRAAGVGALAPRRKTARRVWPTAGPRCWTRAWPIWSPWTTGSRTGLARTDARHTPGHVSVRLASDGADALITGDRITTRSRSRSPRGRAPSTPIPSRPGRRDARSARATPTGPSRCSAPTSTIRPRGAS